jgi:hypothetical protein
MPNARKVHCSENVILLFSLKGLDRLNASRPVDRSERDDHPAAAF